MEKLKVIKLFVGVSVQRQEPKEANIDYDIVTICEFDKNAAKYMN